MCLMLWRCEKCDEAAGHDIPPNLTRTTEREANVCWTAEGLMLLMQYLKSMFTALLVPVSGVSSHIASLRFTCLKHALGQTKPCSSYSHEGHACNVLNHIR